MVALYSATGDLSRNYAMEPHSGRVGFGFDQVPLCSFFPRKIATNSPTLTLRHAERLGLHNANRECTDHLCIENTWHHMHI